MGPDVFKNLLAMEAVSTAWRDIARSLWKDVVKERLSPIDIQWAQQRLKELGKNDEDWKEIARLILEPFNVRISFYTEVTDLAWLTGVNHVWVSVPDGRFLTTRDSLRPGKRRPFYDSATGQLVETIPLRLVDAPWTFTAGIVDVFRTPFRDSQPSTITVEPYVVENDVIKRITGITITNAGRSITTLTATRSIR